MALVIDAVAVNGTLRARLATETNLVTDTIRWADTNAEVKAGNRLIVASKIGDTDDDVKVRELTFWPR